MLTRPDIGGTNVRAALVDCVKGRIESDIESEAIGLDRSPKGFLSLVQKVALRVIQKGKADVVAIAQPGSHDRDGCIFKLAAFPEWGEEKVALAAAVASIFPHVAPPVRVFDDAESAIAGEVFFGSGRLAQTVVTLTLGTGIGSVSSCFVVFLFFPLKNQTQGCFSSARPAVASRSKKLD